MPNTQNVSKIVAKKPTPSNSRDRITYKVSFSTHIILGKIVTAYNEGQCTINAGHSWEAGHEIFWQKADNGIVIMCNNKDCFKNQGGEADGEIEAKQEKASPPKTIEKHTGQPAETQKDDVDIHGGGQGEAKKEEAPQAKTMDVVDFAAEKMKKEYITYAKEIKIIEEALNEVFPGSMEGGERGMKTKLLWDVKHPRLV